MLDKTKVEIVPIDYDGDGVINEVESLIRKPNTLIPIKTQSTELGDSLKELNKSDNENIGLNAIDLRSRLRNIEIRSILILDTLKMYNFLTEDIINLTIQKKRIAVSLEGKGREEIVRITQGQRKHMKDTRGFFARMMNKPIKSEDLREDNE